MAKVFLSLGSNLGDRLRFLRDAMQLIENQDSIKVLKLSSIYETEPIGNVLQSDFYNMVVEIETKLSPRELLRVAKKIEEALRRTRGVHWGPRTMDIDILLYDQKIINEEDLIIPHPEMCRRAFVLVPLIEIEPELKLPEGDLVSHFASRVTNQRIKKIGTLF